MENQLAQANAELKSAREAAALAKAAAAKAASAPPSPAAAATAAEITALQAQLRQVLAQKDALQEVRLHAHTACHPDCCSFRTLNATVWARIPRL